jgi:hypothetical protein
VTGWFENSVIFGSRDGKNITVSGFSPGATFGTFKLVSSGTADMYLAELPPNQRVDEGSERASAS